MKNRSVTKIRLQNGNLQQNGKIRPPEMENITRGIESIYPFARRECNRRDCKRRASHGSS
jgi:hypothetical protein